jgi:hypothetical protein
MLQVDATQPKKWPKRSNRWELMLTCLGALLPKRRTPLTEGVFRRCLSAICTETRKGMFRSFRRFGKERPTCYSQRAMKENS